MFKFLTMLCLLFSFFSYSHSGSLYSSAGTMKRTLAGGCSAWLWKKEKMFSDDYFIHVHGSGIYGTFTEEISESRYYYILNSPGSHTACLYCSSCEMHTGRR